MKILLTIVCLVMTFRMGAEELPDKKNVILKDYPVTVDSPDMAMSLEKILELIQQNRSIILGNMDKEIAQEYLKQSKNQRAPELKLTGDGFYNNNIPLQENSEITNRFLYNVNLSAQIDLYAGGKNHFAIQQGKKLQELSGENLRMVEHDVQVEAFLILYDIYRNIEYLNFTNSYINLREKEYERIHQLYTNGIVLKSDLLRSKLYITDLQKDVIAISNSIDILSDKLCVLLGMEERFDIKPQLENALNFKITETFKQLYEYAREHSPKLKLMRIQKQQEEIALKEIRSENLPHLSLYAEYGIGSPQMICNYNHRLGGEVGARLSLSIDSYYKINHEKKVQIRKIEKEDVLLKQEEENLKNTIYELYTRYQESLVNINRALEKIEMSDESNRILTNSYFNQQALLIDVLESETKSMEAAFEWVEAVVDSQKYYWALKNICGYL